MKLGFRNDFLVGVPNGSVKLKYGVTERLASSFEQFWNKGNPNINMTDEKTLQGQTDTGLLECELDVLLARFIFEKVGRPEWDDSKLQIVLDLTNRQISMAVPFDNGQRYAVGFLKFEVNKTV